MLKLLIATTQDFHILESAIHYAQGRHCGSRLQADEGNGNGHIVGWTLYIAYVFDYVHKILCLW
jgi:hypothetical protein